METFSLPTQEPIQPEPVGTGPTTTDNTTAFIAGGAGVAAAAAAGIFFVRRGGSYRAQINGLDTTKATMNPLYEANPAFDNPMYDPTDMDGNLDDGFDGDKMDTAPIA
jgi:hypothetical protein